MLALLLAVFVCLGFADVTRVYNFEKFDAFLNEPKIVQKENGATLFFAFNAPQCVHAVNIETTEPTSAVFQSISGHKDGVYNWETVGSVESSESTFVIPVIEGSDCGSRFRVTITSGKFVSLNTETTAVDNTRRAKRVTGCDPPNTWPKGCKSSSDGQLCITKNAQNICGCKQDSDCYGNTAYPYCSLLKNICDFCDTVASGAAGDLSKADSVDNHYYCRTRYPSLYTVSGDLGGTGKAPVPMFLTAYPDSEYSAPTTYFREVCYSSPTAEGQCDRCSQASALNTPKFTSITYPVYPGTLSQASREARTGTFFCNFIRGFGSAKPGRPICTDPQNWKDNGFGTLLATDEYQTYKYTMESGNVGSLYPVGGGFTDPAKQNVQLTLTMINWEGACHGCAVQKPDGTTVRLHGLCSIALPTMPICDQTSGNCMKCATNVECGLSTGANCLTDKSGSCTGGLNCQVDGSCKSCVTDADCGALDGGEKKGQAQCTAGICTDKFACDRNFGETTGTAPCPTAALPNCNVGGTCIQCTKNSECGATDGGSKVGQQVCKAGVCVDCSLNSDCVGTSGANCQASGVCVDCTTNPATVCAANADGGQPGAAAVGCVGTAGFCVDKKDQTICNTLTKICEDPCLSNTFCADKGGNGPTSGANCQLSGLCANCQTLPATTLVANSANCGALDGPKMSLAGAVGTPSQPDCSTAGTCVDAFKCTDNASCGGKSGANCQADLSCVNCNIAYSSTTAFTSTCGVLDGGAVGTTGQKNCNSASRLCVNACATNADCAGTQGANCMANGVCLDCRTDADCVAGSGATANSWAGDINAADVLCNAATKICGPGCSSVTNSDCPAGQNCNKDGRCAACATNADCVSNDGPPGKGSNTICKAGVCVDPYTCVPDANDNNNCKLLGAGNNCQGDKTCKTCTANTDCGALDGGSKPRQPVCNTATGVCRDCASNAECGGLNCNADGTCQDCRLFPAGTTCGGVDGPPGATKLNLNCDTVSGACVDFCVSDANCLDSCAPKCQLERGCCVECLTSSHCPVAQWRGTQKATYTHCSIDFMCTLPPPTVVCLHDDDCSGSTPACSFAEQKCVACMYDSHCNGGAVCDTGAQICVECLHDNHCDAAKQCDHRSLSCVNIPSPASALVGSLALFVATLLAMFF